MPYFLILLLLGAACGQKTEPSVITDPKILEALGEAKQGKLTWRERPDDSEILKAIAKETGKQEIHSDYDESDAPIFEFISEDIVKERITNHKYSTHYIKFYSNQLSIYGRNKHGERIINSEEELQLREELYWLK